MTSTSERSICFGCLLLESTSPHLNRFLMPYFCESIFYHLKRTSPGSFITTSVFQYVSLCLCQSSLPFSSYPNNGKHNLTQKLRMNEAAFLACSNFISHDYIQHAGAHIHDYGGLCFHFYLILEHVQLKPSWLVPMAIASIQQGRKMRRIMKMVSAL